VTMGKAKGLRGEGLSVMKTGFTESQEKSFSRQKEGRLAGYIQKEKGGSGDNEAAEEGGNGKIPAIGTKSSLS